MQEITRNVANVFSFYAILAIEHGFSCINIRQVPWEVLKTEAEAEGLGFQHLPWDLANINSWKTMFDPYIIKYCWLWFFVMLCFHTASQMSVFWFICFVASKSKDLCKRWRYNNSYVISILLHTFWIKVSGFIFKRDNSIMFYLTWKGVYSNMKNLLPREQIIFLLQTLFKEGRLCVEYSKHEVKNVKERFFSLDISFGKTSMYPVPLRFLLRICQFFYSLSV